MRRLGIVLALLATGFALGWLAAQDSSSAPRAASRAPFRPPGRAASQPDHPPAPDPAPGPEGARPAPAKEAPDAGDADDAFGLLEVDSHRPDGGTDGTWVEWCDPAGETDSLEAAESADGIDRYRLRPGTYFVVWDDPGSEEVWRQRVEIGPGAVVRVATRRPPTAGAPPRLVFGRLELLVLDLAGEPVPRLHVAVECPGPAGDEPWSDDAGTDAGGMALFRLLPGRYRVTCGGETFPVALAPGERVPLTLRPTRTGEIHLAQAPRGGITLRARGAATEVPAALAVRGDWDPPRLLFVPPGLHTVWLRGTGETEPRPLGDVRVGPGEAVRFDPHLSGIHIGIRTAGDGNAKPSTTLPARLTPLDRGPVLARTALPYLTDLADGRWQLWFSSYDLEPGRWRLSWAPEGFRPLEYEFTVGPAPGARTLQVELQPEG